MSSSGRLAGSMPASAMKAANSRNVIAPSTQGRTSGSETSVSLAVQGPAKRVWQPGRTRSLSTLPRAAMGESTGASSGKSSTKYLRMK